jgi:hypothetical protein
MMDYLSELGKKTQLTVILEKRKVSHRDNSWYGLEREYIKTIVLMKKTSNKKDGVKFRILRYLSKKKYDRIIIANPTTPTGILALLYCRWFHIPFIIQSEGGFQGSGKGLRKNLKNI